MKRQSSSSSSKSSNKKTRFIFSPKDSNILNIKWFSKGDKKENNFNININPKKINTIEIEDNH